MVPPETKYARSGDVSIAYQVHGSGPIDLVYVPGGSTQLELTWEEPTLSRYYERLGSFARVIRLDKRGTGLSDRVIGVPTLEERMDDVRAVMDAADSERAVIYGVSEGGPMALLFAATYPDRVVALVLYGSIVKFVRSDDFPWAPSLETLDRVQEAGERHFGDGVGMQFWAPSVGKDGAIQRWWGRSERQSTSPGTKRAMQLMNREIDVRAVLPSIRVPTLVVHRTGDLLVDVGQARFTASAIPGGELIELPGSDHLPYYENSDLLIDAIEHFLTGQHHEPDHDRVLATVFFTDIVGSTERAGELGDRRWRAVLERHDEIVRGEIARHRGREIKTIGDGFLAISDGPARAIRCACAIRDAVRHLSLEVRAGVHTGEVELIGDDIGGIAVHIGQRVSALARPGEVLVSSTVKDLVAGSGLRFEDRGTHALKGIADPWRLFAVSADDR